MTNRLKREDLQSIKDILAQSLQQPILLDEWPVLQSVEKNIPASVNYEIKRFKRKSSIYINDLSVLEYKKDLENENNNWFTLHFALSGYSYCVEKQKECNYCKEFESDTCLQKEETIDYLRFSFTPQYLQQFVKGKKNNNIIINQMLSFERKENFSQTFTINNKIREDIENFLHHDYSDSLENIFINAQTQMILLHSLEVLQGNDYIEFESKFLLNEEDRMKIYKAREILLQHIGDPITIKALSRKVYINECYLKKGFKEIFGTTIFDFYQSQRMEHAKYLLNEAGKSVTEVSGMLGYSSISHFSTAFKKHTGLKPCDLLAA